MTTESPAQTLCRLARELRAGREQLVDRVEHICDRADLSGRLVVVQVSESFERATVAAFASVDGAACP